MPRIKEKNVYPALYYYNIEDVRKQADGSISVVAEANYDRILLWYIAEDGKFISGTKVEKVQTHLSPAYNAFLSMLPVYIDDNVYFVHNDSPRNLAERGANLHAIVQPKMQQFVLVDIDKNGDFFKTPIYNFKKSELWIQPTRSFKVSDTEYILYGERQKEKALFRLKLDL